MPNWIKLNNGDYINLDLVSIVAIDEAKVDMHCGGDQYTIYNNKRDAAALIAALDRLAVPQDDGVVEMANRVECFLERLGHYLHQSDDEPVWEKEYRDLRTYIKARAGGAA